MIKIGLTGGIGSGKSTVANFFKKKGIPVYNSDERAKYIMEHDPLVKDQLIKSFGPEVFDQQKLNRTYLANLVFNDRNKLKELEKIVHPAVLEDFIRWSQEQTAPYIIAENAILYKTGMDKLVDYIIVVTGDKKKRIERLIKRDHINKNQIEKRMDAQNHEEFLLNNANFIINNNKNIDLLGEKVDLLDKKLKNLLKKS